MTNKRIKTVCCGDFCTGESISTKLVGPHDSGKNNSPDFLINIVIMINCCDYSCILVTKGIYCM